jgi:hypothetical protein
MSGSMQGNQTFAGSSLVPAALPKASSWLQRVVDLGKRLIHKLRTTGLSDGRHDNQMYFGM